MSDIAPVRAAIKATIEAIPDIGRVYDYNYVPDETKGGGIEQARQDFRHTNQKIRAVAFWREAQSVTEFSAGTDGTPRIQTWIWQIAYYGEVDGTGQSEGAHDDRVEQIQDALRANRMLQNPPGTPETETVTDLIVDGEIGAQVTAHDTLNLWGIICHYTGLTLPTMKSSAP